MTCAKTLVLHAAAHTIGANEPPPQLAGARRLIAGLLAASAAAFLAAPVLAQQLAASTDPQAQAPAPLEPGVARWSNRPRFQFGDVLRLDVHARVQTDVRLRDDTEDPEEPLPFRDRVSVPKRRVGVEGVLFNRVEFQAERELRDDTNPWRDVYADVRLHRSFRVRAGQFKVPFSLEQLTSAYNLDFVTRASIVANLAPGRDIGIMVHGRVGNQVLKYEVGAFRFGNGIGLPSATATDLPELSIGAGRTIAARVTIAPLRDGKSRGSKDLEFGAAVVRNDLPEGRFGLPGHLAMGDTFFQRMFVNGSRTRLGLSGQWDAGRARVTGELIRAADTRLGQAVDGSDLSDLVSEGWYVSAVWAVAKARAKHHRGSRLGDVDVAVRLDRLLFGSANQADEPFLNPRADRVATIGNQSLTFGATWSPNTWVKVQANTTRERLVDPLQLLSIGAIPLWSTMLRVQVAM